MRSGMQRTYPASINVGAEYMFQIMMYAAHLQKH